MECGGPNRNPRGARPRGSGRYRNNQKIVDDRPGLWFEERESGVITGVSERSVHDRRADHTRADFDAGAVRSREPQYMNGPDAQCDVEQRRESTGTHLLYRNVGAKGDDMVV